jgi:hypothetical protein
MHQWIQVNFGGESRWVTEVHLQGRGRDCDQWVTAYKLQFSDDGIDWHHVNEHEVFSGTTGMNEIAVNKLHRPVKCRALRLCPTAWNNHISLRWEVFYADF